jgi:hypothetical protein
MPFEKEPKNRLPAGFVPQGGVPYRVKDNDDWANIALNNGIDMNWLIKFNFQTNNTDEINWYLRRYVGCNKPTKDGKNWMFSSSARPGIIYLPPIKWDFEPMDVTGKKGAKTKLATVIPNIEDNSLGNSIAYVLDVIGIVETGIGVFEFELLGFVIAAEVLGPIAGLLNTFVTLENAYADAVKKLKKDKLRLGLSLGVVLGVGQLPISYVKTHFVQHTPFHNVHFPEQTKNLQHEYNRALAVGYAYGKQLNTYQSKVFFADLYSRMKPHPRERYGRDSTKWSERTWKDVYVLCAAVFQRDHLK